MKIVVTGSSGMLGEALALGKPKDVTLFGLARNQIASNENWSKLFSLDLLDLEKVRTTLKELSPNAIIHTAALTNVDECEQNPSYAYDIHVKATKNLLKFAEDLNIPFVYISTDIFYDVSDGALATEENSVKALNVYAQTKLDGEIACRDYSKALILRTNIIGKRKQGQVSFGEWVLNGLRENKPLTMFTDVYFTPLATIDLAKFIYLALKKELHGLFNVGCKGSISKYDFALKVSKLAKLPGQLIQTKIKDKNLLATRPTNLSMDSSLFEGAIGMRLPSADETIKNWFEYVND